MAARFVASPLSRAGVRFGRACFKLVRTRPFQCILPELQLHIGRQAMYTRIGLVILLAATSAICSLSAFAEDTKMPVGKGEVEGLIGCTCQGPTEAGKGCKFFIDENRVAVCQDYGGCSGGCEIYSR